MSGPFYPGWVDDYTAQQRAEGHIRLLPATERQKRLAARDMSRMASLQRVQHSADVKAQRLAGLTRGDQGIPVERS